MWWLERQAAWSVYCGLPLTAGARGLLLQNHQASCLPNGCFWLPCPLELDAEEAVCAAGGQIEESSAHRSLPGEPARTSMQNPFLWSVSPAPSAERPPGQLVEEKDPFHHQHAKDRPVIFHQEMKCLFVVIIIILLYIIY